MADHDMVDYTIQIRKSCNLDHLFHRGMVNNGEFPLFLHMVDATELSRQLSNVGLAQAHLN